MSIKIVFESKRRQEENPYFLYPDDPVTKARGILVGSDVIVDDNASMTFLTNNVNSLFCKLPTNLFMHLGILRFVFGSADELPQHVVFSKARTAGKSVF